METAHAKDRARGNMQKNANLMNEGGKDNTHRHWSPGSMASTQLTEIANGNNLRVRPAQVPSSPGCSTGSTTVQTDAIINLASGSGDGAEQIKSLYRLPHARSGNEEARRQVVDSIASSVQALLLSEGLCSQKELDEQHALQGQCDAATRESPKK